MEMRGKDSRRFLYAIAGGLSTLFHGAVLTLSVPSSPDSEVPSALPLSASEEIPFVVLPQSDIASEVASPPRPAAAPASRPLQVPPPAEIQPVIQPPADPLPQISAPPEQPLEWVEAPIAEPTSEPAVPETEASTETAPPIADIPPEPQVPPLEQTLESAEPSSDSPLVEFETDFPHHSDAEAGCFGLSSCQQVSDGGTYRKVATSLVDQLEEKGYDVRLRDDLEEEAGRQLYELLVPGQPQGDPQYLIVFSNPENGAAVYVVSEQMLTWNDLQTWNAHSQPDGQSG